jgi:hypothetical protein
MNSKFKKIGIDDIDFMENRKIYANIMTKISRI